MPEHLRAIVVILVLAAPVFWFAKAPIGRIVGGEAEIQRDRNFWLVITLFAFLAHSFWIYIVVAGTFAATKAQRHPNILALYVLLLFAVPPFEMEIKGIGPIDHIIAINHYRLLNLTLLLPFAMRLYKAREQKESKLKATDVILAALLIWMFIGRATHDAVSGIVRGAFYSLVDTWLPYYVASRAVKTRDDFIRVASSFVIAGCILGLLALFESARHWLLYESLRDPLGFPEVMTLYLMRGAGGPLRANVSVGNAIVLGYVLMLCLTAFIYLMPKLQPRWKAYAACICIVAGQAGALSRGPWVGAAAMLLMLIWLGPGRGKRLGKAIVWGGFGVIALLISPFGDSVISYLPFVGTVEPGSVDYRSRLFDVSLEVFKQHPIAGDFYYLRNPIMEQMRQGEGIIDMVNTYLQFALPYGAVGLLLFVGVFISAYRATNRARKQNIADADTEFLGRTLLGGLIGILVTIGTVSTIGAISTMYLVWTGLCIGYVRVFGQANLSRIGRRARPPATRMTKLEAGRPSETRVKARDRIEA